MAKVSGKVPIYYFFLTSYGTCPITEHRTFDLNIKFVCSLCYAIIQCYKYSSKYCAIRSGICLSVVVNGLVLRFAKSCDLKCKISTKTMLVP